MFVLGNFFVAIASIINIALQIYLYIVIGSAVLSWVNPDPYNPIVKFLRGATEPVFAAIRKRIPISFGGIDFSPMLVLLGIIFLQKFLVNTLLMLGQKIGM